MLFLADRCAAAYETPAVIRARYPLATLVDILPRSEIQYFIETDSVERSQLLVARGSSNLMNFREDAECWEEVDKDCGLVVHRGFDLAARELLGAILPHLARDHVVIATGHSLGAAVSVIVMIFLRKLGFTVGPTLNFGQPKLTNAAGAKLCAGLPLLRVVDESDVVPLLPPALVLDQLHGAYTHFGPELILLRDQYYVSLDEHRARDKDVEGFWRNLGSECVDEHYMANYLKRVRCKVSGAVAVPFEQRQLYEDPR
jgi:triacylglycerol lipase